jgi:NCS1 family nucleobase:cation symporter-1
MTLEEKKANYSSEVAAGSLHEESIQGEYSTFSEETPSTWQKFLDFVAVEPKGDMTTMQMFLYNHDLRPVEKARRTWSWYNYVFFWVADSFNINTWQIAATGVQAGMTWWQTWLSVWVGYIMCGIFVSLGARIGIMYHISFPVAARSSFGIFGSLWPILNRVVMSCVWYSVQGWIGGQCVQLMLQAIFHNVDQKLDTPLQGGATTTFKFLGFFLFWLGSLPAIWFPPHQIRHLFTFKAYVVPVAGIGFLIWTILKAHGIGPVIHQLSSLKGLALAWVFIESTMNSLANFATLIVNAPDFSRFADKPSFGIKYLVYTLSIPLCFSITSLIGILVSSSSTLLYGTTYWSPLDVLGQFLNSYTSGNRAGVFLISAAFALAQLGTNILANSLSFGTDCTALFPRFINIRRGGFICAALALCICPWNLMSSSSMFTTYLSAYSVFLSSIAGVVACDYFYVRRGYIKLTHLYSLHAPEEPSASSVYMFGRFGVNWRAYVAYICGILPNIVGFVGATKTHEVPIGAVEVYRLNFFMGFFSAAIVYGILCNVSPIAGTPPVAKFEIGWYEEWQEVEDFEEEFTGHVVRSTGIEKSISYISGIA